MDISRKRTINTAMDIILMFCCSRRKYSPGPSAPQKFASLQYHLIQKEHSGKCRSYKKEKEGKKEEKGIPKIGQNKRKYPKSLLGRTNKVKTPTIAP